MTQSEAMVAPAGTPFLCNRCDTQIATLTETLHYGDVVHASSFKLSSGRVPFEGEAILCPNGCTSGFYALVNGERWRAA